MDVVDHAYQYLGMIRCYFRHEEGVNNEDSVGDSDNLPSWIYKEVKTMCEAGFQYADEQSPTDLVEILVESSATTISGLPPERILDGNECLFEFNANIVKVCLFTCFLCYFKCLIVSFETLLSTNCLETRPMYTYRCVCVCALNPSLSFKLDFVLIFIIMLVSFIFVFASFVNCVYSVCH